MGRGDSLPTYKLVIRGLLFISGRGDFLQFGKNSCSREVILVKSKLKICDFEILAYIFHVFRLFYCFIR